MTEVVWAATSATSGRFDVVEQRSDIEVLHERFAALRARGEGYLEVRRVEDYPGLTVGFRGSVAVVQAMTSQDAMSIMVGDGSAQEGQVEVPIMDEIATFTGQAGVSVDRAWSVVQDFLKGRKLTELGKWFEL